MTEKKGIYNIEKQEAGRDIYNIAGNLNITPTKKLADIDSQLKDLYLQLDNYLAEYIETVSASSNDQNLLDVQKYELKRKIRELRTRYPGRVDMEVIKFSDLFFKGICPPELFRAAVGMKIRSLQTERENLIKEFEQK